MTNAMAFQSIGHDLARLICVALEQGLEETLGRFTIPARRYKHIDHFAILTYGTPQDTTPVGRSRHRVSRGPSAPMYVNVGSPWSSRKKTAPSCEKSWVCGVYRVEA
jgi:hypothetical protein